MSTPRPGIYKNDVGGEMHVEGFIGTGVGVNVGWPSIGAISFAESPDDLFGPTGYLVTSQSLRDCGYKLVTPAPDTEAYGALADLDGKLALPDDAVETAAKAMAAYAVHLDPEEDPDQFMTWDEMDEDDREKMRGAARVTIEAALPLLKYAVQ